MNYRILLWSVISALAGFLFGFDTVVISGAEQKIQSVGAVGANLRQLARRFRQFFLLLRRRGAWILRARRDRRHGDGRGEQKC